MEELESKHFGGNMRKLVSVMVISAREGNLLWL